MFIQFNQDDGSPVVIDPNQVAGIQAIKNGLVLIRTSAGLFKVIGSFEDIVRMIDNRFGSIEAMHDEDQKVEHEAFKMLVAMRVKEAKGQSGEADMDPIGYCEMAEAMCAEEMENCVDGTPEFAEAEADYLSWMQAKKDFEAAA